jgi:hypothetical protein
MLRENREERRERERDAMNGTKCWSEFALLLCLDHLLAFLSTTRNNFFLFPSFFSRKKSFCSEEKSGEKLLQFVHFLFLFMPVASGRLKPLGRRQDTQHYDKKQNDTLLNDTIIAFSITIIK